MQNKKQLETSLSLYQPARYTRSGQAWFSDYSDAVNDGSKRLNLDVSAILSILSFNYPCGDRTLFQEIKRQPWLSSISDDGQVRLEAIPPHEYNWESTEAVADKLCALLCREAETVCTGREEIYLLLSGGLDSRIVAGVLYQLRQQGRLKFKPVGVTWGLEDSRDVHYAKATAEMLGFGWKHIPIGPECLLKNIYEGFPLVGGLVPPNHLHGMFWFKEHAGKDALVLAGSYGDSIGRAEFSGRHVLELGFLKPSNPNSLIKQECINEAVQGIQQDLHSLRQRAGDDCPKFAVCELEMQCHYMRGMIAHAMSIINNWCTLYQMFTSPEVYGYMWSLHPARRDDTIYAALLEKLHPGIARLPWARTNRALRGNTEKASAGLTKKFHRYAEWSSQDIYGEMCKLVDPEWFSGTGFFDPEKIRFLNTSLAAGNTNLKQFGFKPYDIWHWLAGYRVFAEKLQKNGYSILSSEGRGPSLGTHVEVENRSTLRRRLSNRPILYKIVKAVRRRFLMKQAIKKWPPGPK